MHRLGGLDPEFRKDVIVLLRTAKKIGINARITSGFRSLRQQAILRSSISSFPLAAPGYSLHQYGLEVDIYSENNQVLGRIWNDMGHRWGGFRDPIAFAV